MDHRSLTGKVAVVTGASRGLGRYAAGLLADAGAAVGVCARSQEDLDSLGSELADRSTAGLFAMPLDLTDVDSVAEFADAIVSDLGSPDILVNNAGVLGPVGPLAEIDIVEWGRTLEVNVSAVASITAALLPAMAERGSGSIVNLSGAGLGGRSVPTRVSAYVASKGAIAALTEAWAREWASEGIRVNAIAPGAVETGLNDPILDAGPERAGQDLYRQTQEQKQAPVSMEAYGDLLLYLASAASTWLTGCLLSARWDSVEMLEARKDRMTGSSLFTLRRIDDVLFAEVEAEAKENP